MNEKIKSLFFFLKKSYQIMPSFFYKQLLRIISDSLGILIVVLIPSLIIQSLENSIDANQAIIAIIGIVSILLMLTVISIQFKKHLKVQGDRLNNLLYKDLTNTIINVKYELMENTAFLEQIHLTISSLQNVDVGETLFTSLPKVTQSLLVLVTLSIVLFQLQPLILLIIYLVVLINFYFSFMTLQKQKESIDTTLKQNKEYWYYLFNFKTPLLAKDIRIYGLQKYISNKITNVFDKFLDSGKQSYCMSNLRDLVAKFANNGLIVGIYVYLIFNADNMGLNASNLILIVNATSGLYNALSVVQREFETLFEYTIYLNEYHKLFKMISLEKHEGDCNFEENINTVEFRNVWFRYPNTDKDVLKGLNFTISDNQTISIVGRNGSGKSTIIKLLARLYKPIKGQILVNGKDIETLEYKSYLRQLSIIFQDFRILRYSLKENVCFNDVNEAKLNRAIKHADFEIELSKFSNGIDTMAAKDFEEGGINLSKGQEQKLAIVRSIYKGGSLMILDEPTASLDPIAEEEVFKHFRNIVDKKLSIMISHRLSSCRNSDRIILIDDGVIKEDGNHDILLNQKGLYANMYQVQKEKYMQV